MKMTNMSTSISIITFTKFVVFVFSLSVVYSLPVTKTKYDQSQQGELNVRADLDNILVLFIPSGGVRLLDSEQIGNIISILGSSRKNAVSSQTSDTKDPPYKIDFEQAAIDKLQSDIDTLNSILPISKNYNKNSKPENKETADETLPQTVNIKEQTTLEDKHESITSSVVIETTSAAPTSSEAPVPVETKLSTSATPDVTTSESVITSIPLIKTTEKDTPVMLKQDSEVTVLQTKPAAEDLSSKLHQRVIDTSAKTQTRSSSAQPAKTSTSSSRTTTSSSSKTPKILDEQQNERQLKALQSGLIHCLPGQRLTAAGDCVEIQSAKESRNERMERLLSMLRFGIQPAYSNN